jgi:molecular chaperone DnaK
VPQIEVSFEVDANGIVSVSAQDKTSGREQQMRITPTSGLAPEEIDRLIREADEFADTDRTTKEVVFARGKLDSLLKNTRKSFLKFGGLMSQEEQDNAESVFLEAEAAGKSEKLDDINRAMHRLERVAMQLTAAMLNASDTVSSESEK